MSLDGADTETHEWVRGVAGCFEKALQGIKNLVSVGFRPQIIMSVMRRNRDQMEPLVRLAESCSAGSVKFNIVQPAARGEQMHNNNETLTIGELVELGRWVENDLAPRSQIQLYHSHPPAFRPLGKIFGSDGDGCGVCGIKGILGVLGDGTYALCASLKRSRNSCLVMLQEMISKTSGMIPPFFRKSVKDSPTNLKGSARSPHESPLPGELPR